MIVKYNLFVRYALTCVVSILSLPFLMGSRDLVYANTCGNVVNYCTAGPCSCTDVGASDGCTGECVWCTDCGSLGCPSPQCDIVDSHGNVIGCNEGASKCLGTGSYYQCPGYLDPCRNTSGCTPNPTTNPEDPGNDPTPEPTHSECIGSSCTTVTGAGSDQCATSADCTILYAATGTVILGSATWNGTSCVSGTGSGVLPGANSYIRLNSTGSSPIDSNGAFSAVASGGTNVFTLVQTDSTYVPNCPPSGIYSQNVTGDVAGLDFYVTTQQVSWWQTRGGNVGANGGSITSNIPGTCTGACKPYVSLYDALLTSQSNGLVWMNALTGSFGVAGNNFSEGTDYKAYNASMSTLSKREGYDYFYRLFEMGLNPTEDSALSGSEANMAKPDSTLQAPTNGRAYFVRAGDGTGSVTINTAWDLTPGESIVVFVDGDLVVNQPITTAVGDFLAFVVSGDITFNVGNGAPSLITPNVQGVFVADGQIVTSADTEQFVGQGIFVGWGGVDMNRDYGDATSNTNPSEFFSYRPDFVTNAPAQMKRPVIRWEEVAP
jgi:hypothetical protein